MSKVLPGSTETYVDWGIFKLFHKVVAEQQLALFVFVLSYSTIRIIRRTP